MFIVSAIVVHKHGSKYTFCSHTESNAHVLPRSAQQLPLSLEQLTGFGLQHDLDLYELWSLSSVFGRSGDEYL